MPMFFRQWQCRDLLKAKAKRLFVFESGTIVKLHKQGIIVPSLPTLDELKKGPGHEHANAFADMSAQPT